MALELTVTIRGGVAEVRDFLRNAFNQADNIDVRVDSALTSEELTDRRAEVERMWSEIGSPNAKRLLAEIATQPAPQGYPADALWDAVGTDNRRGPGMLSSIGIAERRVFGKGTNFLGWNATTRMFMMDEETAGIVRELAEDEAGLSSGKYAPITEYLHAAAADSVTLTFGEIEGIIVAELPPSARSRREWWANERAGGHTQARAWMGAGWRVAEIDLPGERVTFRRSNG